MRGTIVIAEDDAATRVVLKQLLVREDFRVVAVANGKLACEAVRRERPDVVLLDWRMPVMDGRAVLEELRSHRETRGIPIVMLTSNAQVDERIIALEAGVQDYLSKPCDPRELVACIEQQLRWRDGLAGDADSAFFAERAAGERRRRLVAEAMPHIVWLAGLDGRITYFNRAWYDYAGGTSGEADAGAWMSALHPQDRLPARTAWAASRQAGRPCELQCRLRRASDAAYRWHLVRATPSSDDADRIVEWVGSCTDIHDYRIAAETRAILDTMDSMVAIRTDDGFIHYASPYLRQYTGATDAAVLGFGWRRFVHPADLERMDLRREALGTSQAGDARLEVRLRGADGAYRWFSTKTVPLPGAAETRRRWLDTATDIDDLKALQSALTTSEAQYRVLTDSVPQMVWVTANDAAFAYVNHRWAAYTGLDLGATRACGWEAVVHADDRAALDSLRETPAQADLRCEARFRRNDGAYRWHVVCAVPFKDADGHATGWIATATDVQESKSAAALLASTVAALEHVAHHDAMTGLPNRTLLLERLAQAIALAKRGNTQAIVLFIDLDGFKRINDERGHAAGDRVLAATGARLAQALRVGDTASRVGGDEFILVCATADAAGEAARLATRVIGAIGAPVEVDGYPVMVGASIGISTYPADGASGDELIRKADQAMYSAKQSGRNLFRIYKDAADSSSIAAGSTDSDGVESRRLH